MGKRNTILVSIRRQNESEKEIERGLSELQSLVDTLGDATVISVVQARRVPNGKTFIGSGKAEEILELAKAKDCDQIIFNGILTPAQIKNLLDVFPAGYEIMDRVELILKIFRKHATTDESKLQIELAEIQYLLPRLSGKGKELSRLGGGIGTRGPGEQQKEFEKRMFKDRISEIKKLLTLAQTKHETQRKNRLRSGKPSVALLGYTNAGKSTLFRTLSKKDTLVANKLFATLDTKIGNVWIPSLNQEVLLSDTIGFISDLPPFLIESFQTTLAEARHADLMLHVIDYSDPAFRQKKKDVEEILEKLEMGDKPMLNVYNKIDLAKKKVPRGKNNLGISAIDKTGLDELKDRIGEILA